MGLINWCDEKISELKQDKRIVFANGRPQVPPEMRYDGIPDYIETYQFRNEIPIESRANSLICFYSLEDKLKNRLNTIDNDVKNIYTKFAGIVGMDMSPSVNMLRPRQRFSILINNIYDCLVAVRGIKVAINCRAGDLKTLSIIEEYPHSKTIVFGNIGCKGIFAGLSTFVMNQWIYRSRPTTICVYGTLSNIDRKMIEQLSTESITIHLFHGHNYANEGNKKSVFISCDNKYTRNNPRQGYVCDLIVSHGIQENKPFDFCSSKGGDIHGC